ncbi:MAG: NPCBM/NEW2 domain-containing protein, partial [Planctomycetes bacterium]|nr:NPCBM/NEW2 domain-containing protein [Planctomycetota bacterium]
ARVEQSEGAGVPRLVLPGAVGNPPTFARRLTEPPKLLDLLDIVAGGDGTGQHRERGIDPTTGMEDPVFLFREMARPGERPYRLVGWHKLIDGVFVPDGRAGPVQLDSGGHVFALPGTDGQFYGSIWARAAKVDPRVKEMNYWVHAIDRYEQFTPEKRGLLCLHANVGITFNLEGMRKMYPDQRPARFRAVAGVGEDPSIKEDPRLKDMEVGMADVWVFVDGRLKMRRQLRRRDAPVALDVELGPSDRFLTLVSTDGGNGSAFDRVVFGDPVLKMTPAASEKSVEDK